MSNGVKLKRTAKVDDKLAESFYIPSFEMEHNFLRASVLLYNLELPSFSDASTA
jgi:hypothetical protein